MSEKAILRRGLPLLLACATLAAAGCLLIPDDREKGAQVSNQRPTVRITGGAATPDPDGIDYKVQFYWSGSDADGQVLQYEWAVDDTVTEQAWRDTTGFSARFRFSATAGPRLPDSLFTDWHTFYIRAVDNESALSLPDLRHFNARTIAPRSRITFPKLGDTSELQRTTLVNWDGEDFDSSRPDQKPVFFEYKLVRLPPGAFPSTDPQAYVFYLRAGDNELSQLPGAAKKNWTRVDGSVRSMVLRDLPGRQAFVFGVRAIDEAGAIEPALNLNRNLIAFVVSEAISQPNVTISEERLGNFTFPGNGDIWDIQIPSGVDLNFRWTGDASAYGSLPGNSNYALDIPDPEDESIRNDRGIGGWIGWGLWPGNQFPIRFDEDQAGTTHYLYVKMRDISDTRTSERKCIVKMKVVGFSFVKLALVVDDARFQVAISDRMHDAFINNVFLRRLQELRERYGDVDYVPIFDGDAEGGEPRVLTLERMAEYQHVLWSAEPRNTRSGIAHDLGDGQNNNETGLISYITAGGRFFAFGGQIGGMNRSDFGYPVGPPANAADPKNKMIYYRYFYMPNLVVSSACAEDPICDTCYGYVSGLLAVRSLNPAFPDLRIDPTKWDPWVVEEGQYKGGLKKWEGSFAPFTQDPLQFAGLDSLYAAETWNHAMITDCNHASRVDGAICGRRYESTRADTLRNRQHGRVMVFDFQPWWFVRDQIASAGTAAINWLVTGRDQ